VARRLDHQAGCAGSATGATLTRRKAQGQGCGCRSGGAGSDSPAFLCPGLGIGTWNIRWLGCPFGMLRRRTLMAGRRFLGFAPLLRG